MLKLNKGNFTSAINKWRIFFGLNTKSLLSKGSASRLLNPTFLQIEKSVIIIKN